MQRWKRELIRAAVAATIALGCYWMASCAQQPMTAPSSGAVRSGISQAQSLQSQVDQTARSVQRTNDRIDAKDAFLQGYYKWKAQHQTKPPPPQ